MSDLNAAPSSTEPAADVAPMTPAELAALPDWVKNGQPPAPEAGTAAVGESNAVPAAAEPTLANAMDSAAASRNLMANGEPLDGGEDAEQAIDPVAHLSRLDGMLAELERKLALGIHTFAHEITAARDHLAKLL